MGVVRLHLHLIAIVTVFAQLAMPALASAALCCNIPQQAAPASHAPSDCCAENTGHACPLQKPHADGHHAETHHAETHHADGQQAESHHSTDGTVRPACQFDDRIVELLLGTTAVMPAPTAVTPPAFTASQNERPTIGRPLWTAPADLPPPKA